MSDLIQAAQQMLQALEQGSQTRRTYGEAAAAVDLRAALDAAVEEPSTFRKYMREEVARDMTNIYKAFEAVAEPVASVQPRLTVRLSSFPESNGKRNWTALLVRVDEWGGLVGNCGGITIERGEFWNRVAYEAERAKLLIGLRDTEPHILDYGDDIQTPEEWAGEVRGGRRVSDRYTTTRAAAPCDRVSLTDKQIENLDCIELDRECYEIFSIRKSSVLEFARAIERAHGIKGEE